MKESQKKLERERTKDAIIQKLMSSAEKKDKSSLLSDLFKSKNQTGQLMLNIKRVKKLVFNQEKTQFALIWCNQPKEVDTNEKNYELLKEYCQSQANDPKMNQGFTLYDALTLKPVFVFNKNMFNIAGLKDYTIMDLSLFFETQRAVIVFEKQPKKVYFFDFNNICDPMVSRNTDEEIEEKERK